MIYSGFEEYCKQYESPGLEGLFIGDLSKFMVW